MELGKLLEKTRCRYSIIGTSLKGKYTGRRRYRVQCLECKEVLHEGTMDPEEPIEEHEFDPCDAQRKRLK